MYVAGLFGKRRGSVTGRHNNAVCRNLELSAILASYGYAILMYLCKGGLKMHGHRVSLEEVTKEAGVCQTDTLGSDEVVLHLYDNGLLTLEIELICDLASGKTTAYDNHVLANGLVAEEEVTSLNAVLLHALNGNNVGSRTCCDNNLVSAESLDIGNLGVEFNLDRILSKLTDVPCDKSSVLLLEGGSSCSNEYTAEFVGFFIHGYLVTALCKEDCRLHTADTATDYGYVLLLLGGLYVILLRLHGLGVECATCKAHGVGKVLSVVVSLGGREVEASCVTADTRLDVIESVLDKLGDPLGVNEELTGNAHSVDLALSDSLGADLGIHSTCADHGNVNELFDMRNRVEITVLGHVHRGMSPVPGVVGTVVRIEHIIACVLKVLSRSLGLLHVTSYLNVLFTGNCSLSEALELGLYGVTERYGIILTALCLDSLYDLSRKAIAVLKGSAVLVGTLVVELDSELVEEVALVYCVYLNTVNACVTAELCSLGKRLYNLVDMMLGHLGADDIGCPSGGLLRGGHELVLGVDNRLDKFADNLILVKLTYKVGDSPRASHTCGELDEELCAGLVDLVHEDLKLLEHLGVLPEPLAPEGVAKRRDAGDDKTYVVIRSLEEELCSLFIKAAAGKLKPAEKRGTAHRAHYNSVFNLYVTYFPRCKQSFILRTHFIFLHIIYI